MDKRKVKRFVGFKTPLVEKVLMVWKYTYQRWILAFRNLHNTKITTLSSNLFSTLGACYFSMSNGNHGTGMSMWVLAADDNL